MIWQLQPCAVALLCMAAEHPARQGRQQRSRQPLRRTFQVVSLRRLPAVSSFTASRICCSKSSITSSISSHPSGAVLFFSLRSRIGERGWCERQRRWQTPVAAGAWQHPAQARRLHCAARLAAVCFQGLRCGCPEPRRGRRARLAAGQSVSTSGGRRRHSPPPEGRHRCCWAARAARSAWSSVPGCEVGSCLALLCSADVLFREDSKSRAECSHKAARHEV